VRSEYVVDTVFATDIRCRLAFTFTIGLDAPGNVIAIGVPSRN
jgi:hypothetical protein